MALATNSFPVPLSRRDEHVGRTIGYPPNEIEHRLDRLALTQYLVEAVLLADLLLSRLTSRRNAASLITRSTTRISSSS